MAQPWAKQFYHSAKWLRTRKNYMMRPIETPAGICPPGMCELCYERGDMVPAKVVHHIEHLTPQNIDDPHYTLRYDNLQRLCQDCHALVHGDREEQRVTFDENGNLVPIESANTIQAQVMRLTSTQPERRNIHKEAL